MSMERRIAGFVQDKLDAEATDDGGVARVRLDGSASHRDVAPLEELFGELHAACARGGIREVVVDLRTLAYLNSSHFKTLVSWIGRMQKLEPRIPVRFLSNDQHHWQKRSLHALRHLAEDFVFIE
jgi:hypothetical protein